MTNQRSKNMKLLKSAVIIALLATGYFSGFFGTLWEGIKIFTMGYLVPLVILYAIFAPAFKKN